MRQSKRSSRHNRRRARGSDLRRRLAERLGSETLEQRLALTASPIEMRTSFLIGAELLELPAIEWPAYVSVSDSSQNAATLVHTSMGSLIGLGTFGGEGRVAVIGDTDALNTGLATDPAAGGWARGVFNVYSWLSGRDRAVGDAIDLKVLRVATDAPSRIANGHSMFHESFSGLLTSSGTGSPGAIEAGDVSFFSSGGDIRAALSADGAWTRSYDVVELPANAPQDVVDLVEEWLVACGGGVLVSGDRGPLGEAVRGFVADVGLSIAQGGAHLPASTIEPTAVNGTDPGVVLAQLTGITGSARGQSAALPILVQGDVRLPSEILGGRVAWSSSAPAILSSTGAVGGDGDVTLTAQVTFANGDTEAFDVYYRVFRPQAGTGLTLRVIDTSGFTVGGSRPDDTAIDAFLNASLLASTPAYSANVAAPAWTSDSPNPSGVAGGLWVYSGYLMPSTSGEHTLRLSADDSAKLFLEVDGAVGSQSAVWWSASERAVTLEAGRGYRMWLFFKPSSGGTNNVALQWRGPGDAAFAAIPASRFGNLAAGQLDPTAGYPADLLPWSGTETGSAGSWVLDVDSRHAIYGNVAPVSANQEFNFVENRLFWRPQDLALTDAVAAQVKTLTIRVTNTDGSQAFLVQNRVLSGVTDGDSLAEAIQGVLTAADLASGGSGSLTAAYEGNVLTIRDSAGRGIRDLILTRANPHLSVRSGTPVYSPGQAVLPFDVNQWQTVTRLSLTLAAGTADEVALADLTLQNVSLGPGTNLAGYMQDAIRKAMGNADVTVTNHASNPATPGTLDSLLFVDTRGRSFSNVRLTNQSAYLPLVSMAGGTVGGGDEPTVARVGGITGRVDAQDFNADQLVYALVEPPKFGTVSLDTATGDWFYRPSADGSFGGFDQFTVTVTDARGGATGPIGIRITSEQAPQIAEPVVTTVTLPEPSYTEPAVNGRAVPGDLVVDGLFVAQTHVIPVADTATRPLVGSRWALLKLNVSSLSGSLAPDFVVTATDADGQVLGSLRLTGPGTLPTGVELPTVENQGLPEHTNANSYVAPLPSGWIQPGTRFVVTAGTGDDRAVLQEFTPGVGVPLRMAYPYFTTSLYTSNTTQYLGGMINWAYHSLAHLPAQAITIVQYPAIEWGQIGNGAGGWWQTYSGQNDSLPGADAWFWGGAYAGQISWAIKQAARLRVANGSFASSPYVAATPNLGGGLGGGSAGGGDANAVVMWHESMGHAQWLSHPSNGGPYGFNGWQGPNWGYNQFTGDYLSTSRLRPDGSVELSVTPMDPYGGNSFDHPGNTFPMFTDTEVATIQNYYASQIEWVPDPDGVVPERIGDGYYRRWDQANSRWQILSAADFGSELPDVPRQYDVPVYYLALNFATPTGARAVAGGPYAENLKIVPVQTRGNLAEPFHDILSGAGRAKVGATATGDYVARVTYATPTGLLFDHLVIPSNWQESFTGFNIPVKGELVRVDIVEAPDANPAAYLTGRTVMSYVNSDALANTVFRGDPTFTGSAAATLALPAFWKGAPVTWSATSPGLVNPTTGAIDPTKLTTGSALKARWVEGGVLREQVFTLSLPSPDVLRAAVFGGFASPGAEMIVATTNLDLPATAAGGAVVWTSSAPAVMTATGELRAAGTATLTATVTYPNGGSQSQSIVVRAVPSSALARRTPAVMEQLFGTAFEAADVTVPRMVATDLALPATITGGTVEWWSSNTAVLDHDGRLVAPGRATLTATVTFGDGTVGSYSQVHVALTEASALAAQPTPSGQDPRITAFNTAHGLRLRVIDLTGSGGGVGLDRLLTPDTLSRAPIWSGVAVPDWLRNVGQNAVARETVPAALRNTDGNIREAIWHYSGFFVPEVTGTYTFRILADDTGRLFIGEPGEVQTAGPGTSLTMDLEAGALVPVTIVFKTAAPVGNALYWADQIQLQVQNPGAAGLAAVAADRLAPLPADAVSPLGGFPWELFPRVQGGVFDTGTGLQLRVLPLAGVTPTSGVAGIAAYLQPGLLERAPAYSGTALPGYLKPVAAYGNVAVPDVLRDQEGYVAESLWIYSGYLIPEVSGTYTFEFAADDLGRFAIASADGIRSLDRSYSGGTGTLTVDLVAGQAAPVWVFFKTGAGDSYWADLVSLRWKLPGADTFTAIPGQQLAPVPDDLVSPAEGYPLALLPGASATLPARDATQVAANTAFIPLGVIPDSALPTAATTVAIADRGFISGAVFDRTVTVPEALAGPGLQRWLTLTERLADGSLVERSPAEPWQITVSGTSLTVRGRLDSRPGIWVESITVHADDNPFDSTPAATVSFDINPDAGAIGLSSNALPTGVPSGAVIGTLSMAAGSGYSYAIVPSTGFTATSDLFQIVGDELRTATSFSTSLDDVYELTIRATATNGTFSERTFTLVPGASDTLTPLPATKTVVAGETVVFTASASGWPAYQWQVSRDAGTTWTDVEGATAKVFSFVATADMNRLQYRFVTTTGDDERASAAATLGVRSLSVTTWLDGDVIGTTFRDAVTYATTRSTGTPTITFDPAVFAEPREIVLESALPTLFNPAGWLAIEGPGASRLTLRMDPDAAEPFRAFVISQPNSSMIADLSGMTLTGFRAIGEDYSDEAGWGGAILNYDVLYVSGMEFVDNQASHYGGAIDNEGFLLVESSSFINNRAVDEQGGAIYSVVAEITNSTFSGNSAGWSGGAIYAAGMTTLSSTTITGNATGRDGGGIYISTSASPLITIANTIIAGNTAARNAPDAGGGAVTSAAANLIGIGGISGIVNGVAGNQVGTSAAPLDPLLGALSRSGGQTSSRVPLAGSPVIDAGSSTAALTDQAGVIRAFYGAAADIGAREHSKDSPLAVATEPADATVWAGGTATFTAAAAGVADATTQWYQSVDGGATWTPVAGATQTTLSVPATPEADGTRYRAVFASGAARAVSAAARLTVRQAPVVTLQPTDVFVVRNATISFTAAAAGSPAPTIQWQASVDGVTWADIPGATAAEYRIAASDAAAGFRYRAVFSNANGTAATEAASLQLRGAPAVLTGPANAAVPLAGNASFTATATADPTLVIQWQRSDDGQRWSDITGATGETYVLPSATLGDDGDRFRAVFTTTYGVAFSEPATLTVASSQPTLTLTGGLLTALVTTYGQASAAVTTTIAGSNLSGDVTATAPSGFQVSSDGVSWGSTAVFTVTAGTFSGTLSVRLGATAVVGGTYDAQDIVLSSTGATSIAIVTAATGNRVLPKTLSIAADAQSKIYGDPDPVLTYVASGLIGSDTLSGALARAAGKNVGSYAISQGSLSAGSNYSISFAGANLTIAPKPVTVDGVVVASRPYDGTRAATITAATLAGAVDGDAVTLVVGPASFADARASAELKPVAADFSLTGVDAGNYLLAQPTRLSAMITAKALTLDAAAALNKPYDGTTAATITGTLAGVVGSDVVSFVGTGTFASADRGDGIAVTGSLTLFGRDAGNYAVTQPTGLTANITAGVASIPTLNLGTRLAGTSVTMPATATSGATITYTSSDTSVATVSGNVISFVGAGYVRITASAAATANYEALAAEQTAKVVASAGPATLAAGDLAVVGYRADGAPDTISVLTLVDLTPGTTFYVSDNEVLATRSARFTDLSESEGMFTVAAGQIIPAGTVLSLEWRAGATSGDPRFTWSVTGDAGLGQSNDEIFLYTAASASAADQLRPTQFLYGVAIGGSPTARPAGLVDGRTFIRTSGDTLRYKTSGATSAGAPATLLAAIGTPGANWESGDPAAADYRFLLPQPQVVTFDAVGPKTYGDASFTLTATAFSGGEVTFTSSDPTVATIAGSRVTIVGSGTATITASVAGNDEYLAASATLPLTISRKSVTVTAVAASKTYGDADPTLTYTADGLVGGDMLSGTLSRVAGEHVGTYAIEVGTLANPNYTVSFTGADLTVTPKALTITAGDVTKGATQTLIGGAGSTAFTTDGLVAGETIGSVTIAYGPAGAAGFNGNETGTYPNQVTPSAAAGGSFTASNYAITYVAGSIVVDSAPAISVSPDTLAALATTYGTSSIVATFAVAGSTLSPGVLTVTAPTGFQVSLDNATFGSTQTIAIADGVVPTTTVYVRIPGTTAAGTYANAAVTVSGGGAPPQSVAIASSTVAKKELSITGLAFAAKAYDRTTTAPSATAAAFAGLVNGESFTPAGASWAFADSGAGVDKPLVRVGAYAAPSGNYTVVQPERTATITPRVLTVAATGGAKTYGAPDPVLAFTASGLVPGDRITGALSRASGNTVGSYAINQGSISAGPNYAVAFTGANFTVNPRPVTILADAVSKVAGQADPLLTFRVSPATPLASGDLVPTAFTGGLLRAAGDGQGTYAISQGSLAGANYQITFVGADFTVLSAATPLKVTGAFVRGSGWSNTYLDLPVFTTEGSNRLGWSLADGAAQLTDAATLGWSNINVISLRFNQPIAQPAAGALSLVFGGSTVAGASTTALGAPTLVEGGTVAQWTLPAALTTGKYRIVATSSLFAAADDAGNTLDGEWATYAGSFVTGSGDGTSGGDFAYDFDVLVGNAMTGDRQAGREAMAVNAADNSFVRSVVGKALTALTFRADIDGSGSISSADLSTVQARIRSGVAASLTSLYYVDPVGRPRR